MSNIKNNTYVNSIKTNVTNTVTAARKGIADTATAAREGVTNTATAARKGVACAVSTTHDVIANTATATRKDLANLGENVNEAVDHLLQPITSKPASPKPATCGSSAFTQAFKSTTIASARVGASVPSVLQPVADFLKPTTVAGASSSQFQKLVGALRATAFQGLSLGIAAGKFVAAGIGGAVGAAVGIFAGLTALAKFENAKAPAKLEDPKVGVSFEVGENDYVSVKLAYGNDTSKAQPAL